MTNQSAATIAKENPRTALSDGQLAARLNEAQIALVVLSKDNYNEQKMRVAGIIAKNYSKICYLTFNKPYSTIEKDFAKSKIDAAKFFFLDASPKTKVPKDKRVLAVSSPTELTAISIDFSEISGNALDYTILDSIDVLVVYVGLKSTIQFAHSMINGVRTTEGKLLLILIDSKETVDMYKDVLIFVDDVINLAY